MEHEKHKKFKIKKEKLWMIISGILAVLFIISISTGGFGKGEGTSGGKLSSQEAADKAINYINTNLMQPGQTASVKGVEDTGNLYNIKLDIGGREFDSYVTKDGNLLFPSVVDLEVTPQIQQPSQPTEITRLEVSVDDDAVKGDSDAPVTIIEFSDFECPFCTRFYQNTLSQIDEKYIKTGKVKFVYRDFPLNIHANAQKAGEAAECAGEQGKFWEMHDKLFDDGVSGGVDSFKQYASDLGLDTTKFNECLDSDKMASEVQKDFSDGSAAGVSGTPAFFINGIFISGAQPFEAFEQVIEAELAK
jgi:protein-disulfide isomerase